MKTIIQEFHDINYAVLHSTNKTALTPLETRLRKLRDEYVNDNRYSSKLKRIVQRQYKTSSKLVNKMRKKLR